MAKEVNIKDELIKLGKEFNVLLVVPAEKLQQNMNEALKFLISNATPGIYISLSKPYSSIKKNLEINRIDAKHILFIDCITKSVSTPQKHKDIAYVHSPADLTGLGIALGEFMEYISSNKFLLIGSLNTLLIYNKMNIVAAFVGSITGKSAVWGIKNVIVASPGNEEFIKKITPFFDKLVRIE